MGYVLWLHEIGREHLAEAGSKASNLGELARAGFPVPYGFVLTTPAFELFRNNGGVPVTGIGQDILSVPLPNEIMNLLRASMDRLGQIPLAVRSSAVAEDLAGASFAGQYETVLGVEGADALADAVHRCWASCFSERVTTYQ